MSPEAIILEQLYEEKKKEKEVIEKTKIVAYPVKWEVYSNDDMIAKFDAFDEDTFEIQISNSIISGTEMISLGALLKQAEVQLKEGLVVNSPKDKTSVG